MSTPTDEQEIVEGAEETAEERKPWWWWFRVEIPEKGQKREDFIGIILVILVLETVLGPFIGLMFRSVFGWPF